MNYKRLWSKEALAAWYAEPILYVCARETVSMRGSRGWKSETGVLMSIQLTYLCNSSNGVGKLLQ